MGGEVGWPPGLKPLRRMSQYFSSMPASSGSGMSNFVSDFRLLMAGSGSRGGMLLFLGFWR